jgi:hypothetical protein
MHDIASNRTPELTMMYSHTNGQISMGSGESFYDRNLIRISAVPMQSRMSGDCGMKYGNHNPRGLGKD